MTMQSKEQYMKLSELAARAETSARTIRLYISMGLLPGPVRAGRNAAYDATHLERLQRIRELQRDGLTLAQARNVLTLGQDACAPVPSVPWQHYLLAEDVQVLVRGDAPPWRIRAIQTAISQLCCWLDAAGTTKEQHNE